MTEPGYSPEFTATSRGLTAEALLREAARLARFDGTYDALDLADRIDEFLAEPCSNYTAKSWSPTSPQPEDDRCVNCGHPEATHHQATLARIVDAYDSFNERDPHDIGPLDRLINEARLTTRDTIERQQP